MQFPLEQTFHQRLPKAFDQQTFWEFHQLSHFLAESAHHTEHEVLFKNKKMYMFLLSPQEINRIFLN